MVMTHIFYIFSKHHTFEKNIWKYCPNEIQDKHKKLVIESYFFKAALHVFYKRHFYKQYRLRFHSK